MSPTGPTVVEVRTEPVFVAGTPRPLFDSETLRSWSMVGAPVPRESTIFPAPDGKRFLGRRRLARSEIDRIHVVSN